MVSPDNLRYSKEHEWVKIEGDTATIGISDFAQKQLTDIVFVELPEVSKQIEQSKVIATVESVKSVSDIFTPLSGEIIEINEKLKDSPELINNDPYGEGWIFKLKLTNTGEAEDLMSNTEYDTFTEKEGH